MKLMSTDDLLLGQAQPIKPSYSFQNELLLNGITKEEIELFLTSGIMDENCSPFDPYANAMGYTYEWGHILEKVYSKNEDGKISHFASWSFCLDGLLAVCHGKGLCMRDLSVLCLDILLNQQRRPCFYWQIPSYIHVFPEWNVSAFSLMAGGAGSNGLDEIACAREWIACCFLDPILDRAIHVATKSLRKLK